MRRLQNKTMDHEVLKQMINRLSELKIGIPHIANLKETNRMSIPNGEPMNTFGEQNHPPPQESDDYVFKTELGEGFASWTVFIHSAYGVVFKALDQQSNEYVAIKKVNGIQQNAFAVESSMLEHCRSKFIVRYYSIVQKEEEYWVDSSAANERIDCNGVLSLWLPGKSGKEWKPFFGE